MAELENRPKTEAAFARRLGRLSAKHRRELRDLLGDPPDPTRVPVSFWERVEREREEELTAILLLLFVTAAEQHGLRDEMFDGASVASRQGVSWARGEAATVAGQYAETSRDILNRKTTFTASDLVDVFGPERDENAAVTETTRAASAGGEAAVFNTGGVTSQDLWITEVDDRRCAICKPLHRKPRLEWSRFFPQGPPAHPRCRCFLQYVNEAKQ